MFGLAKPNQTWEISRWEGEIMKNEIELQEELKSLGKGRAEKNNMRY